MPPSSNIFYIDYFTYRPQPDFTYRPQTALQSKVANNLYL